MNNSWKASLQQVIQNWMTTVLGLLKSGKLRLRRTTDQGDLIKLLGEWYERFDLITREILLDGTAQSLRNEEALRDRSGRLDNINSHEVGRLQNFAMGSDWNRIGIVCRNQDHSWTGWMIKCGIDRKEFPMLQEKEKNILLFGECLWLSRWIQRHSWERISKTIRIILRILQISHWRKCSIYLQN